MKDIIDFYFDENYGKLYEKAENGRAEVFRYEDKNGSVSNQFLVRKIPTQINGTNYYDIVTPYGYGGPIVEKIIENKEELLKSFEKNFSEYCKNNNIVSEFVRFHPLIKNHDTFKEMYNSRYIRKVLITKLDKEEPVKNQFGKYCRKNIRQAINKGMTYKVTKSPEQIGNFKEIYYSTMDRNNAEKYYYSFDDEYFDNILKYYRENIIFVEVIFEDKTIAAEICFIYNNKIYAHLSGTLVEYIKLSPSYLLNYAITLWGIENGYKTFFHGGGKTNNKDDTLYLFKKNFAQKYDADFYIGNKIWNEDIYNKLCQLKNIDKHEEFFPAYRK